MRDEKFLVRSLFFSSRTSENARTSDLENERQNLFLIQNRRRQKFCPKDCFFFCSKKNKFRSFDQKFKKTANEFYNRQRENNEKIRRRRSPLGRNSTHHFVVLIYINRSHLK